jgi:hypothetical protein
MDSKLDEIAARKKIIRENMQWKETSELVDIWLASDTTDWTFEALEVVEQILIERGEDLIMLEQHKEEIDKFSLESTDDGTRILPEFSKHSFSQNPQKANRETIQTQSGFETYFRKSKDSSIEYLECMFCDARIPPDAKFCPQCGNTLYPESLSDEENNNVENKGLFVELSELNLDELNKALQDTDLRELNHSDTLAWRHAYERFGSLPLILLDFGEILQHYYPFLSDETVYLQGYPGNRTMPGKWGLDYFETNAEVGHESGVFLSKLIHFSVRTKNPFYIFVLLLAGTVFMIPLIETTTSGISSVLLFIPLFILGFFFLGNAILCILHYSDLDD